MSLLYLGIDVAGARNTWVGGLTWHEDHLEVAVKPSLSSLEEIVEYCRAHRVAGAAIDAQLTMSLSAERGFRASDRQLRALLPPDCRNWVASVHSLMAVPVRGQLLSDFLAPLVGTVLETHPRACLLFGLDAAAMDAVRAYKGRDNAQAHVKTLWARWAERFGIRSDLLIATDGALDALVCATVAHLYHRAPETLTWLASDAPDLRGRGPFYVVAPAKER
jgi:predicted nuclease with RNAse H fold